MNGPGTPNEAHYTGNSMRGVFVPGEILFLAETAFETLQTGDVVAIFERTPYYVHRIVEKDASGAVTMGDNNDRPDPLKLTPDSRIKLVVRARSLNGAVRPVPGGEAGMEMFRRQQRRRKIRRIAGCLLRPFKPLKFLRLPANTETRFRDGTVQWSFGRIPVAAGAPDGKRMYLHWSKRLFFRIPKQASGTASGQSAQENKPKEGNEP